MMRKEISQYFRLPVGTGGFKREFKGENVLFNGENSINEPKTTLYFNTAFDKIDYIIVSAKGR
jgi:hypothetical protein